MITQYEFNKTLSELMNEAAENSNNTLSMDERCTDIYNNRILRELSNEDLKVMIDNGIALDIMVPFAIDILEENIMSEGGQYPGDLLQSVSSIQTLYWAQNFDQKGRLRQILESNIEMLSGVLKHITAL
ncbi:MAG: hypothetical protein JEZ08_05085 [Clostridiales bacterium]|nr:hypothetical protein [Clostridiales bacterium]